MIRILVFLVVALLGYVGTVAAAFVYWDLTGASGPDYTPLLVVLFALAPAAAIGLGLLAAGVRPRRRARPAAAPAGGVHRRATPLQVAIVVVVMAAIGAVMLALDHVPLHIRIPR